MTYNFAAESFHTKKFVADLLREKPKFYTGNEKIAFEGSL